MFQCYHRPRVSQDFLESLEFQEPPALQVSRDLLGPEVCLECLVLLESLAAALLDSMFARSESQAHMPSN